MSKILKTFIFAAIGVVSATAMAQTVTFDRDRHSGFGYMVDSNSGVVLSSGGLCWRTSYWTPAMAIEFCDPDLVTKTPAAPLTKVKPVAKKVAFAADTLFDYGSAALRPEGRAKLNNLANQARQIAIEVFIATGHADRLGGNAYNQALSERRALAVRNYLVSLGIDQNRIYAEGKGESVPVTGNRCQGETVTKGLIACLQPDRRVEIEVIGTRVQ